MTELTQEEKDQKEMTLLCPSWRKALLDAHAVIERVGELCLKPRNWVLEQLGLSNTAKFKAVEKALDKQNEIL